MTNSETKIIFFKNASEWVCDSYSWGFAYLATRRGNDILLLDAVLHISPLPPVGTQSFSIEAGSLIAGREIIPSLSKIKILDLLRKAADGKIKANGLSFKLESLTDIDYYSAISSKDTWYSDLHLQVSGTKLAPPSIQDIVENESALRCGSIPFDGLADLGALLQVSDSRVNGQAPRINIHIGPPADILFAETALRSNRLKLTINAHPKLNLKAIGIAIRTFPEPSLNARKQVATNISWARAKGGIRKGYLDLPVNNSDSVLALLTIGGRTVRRQYFLDPEKATNARYVSTQFFDRELRQLRLSVLESVDSDRFERGIASVLFLLGFSSAIQVETQAPDIIVTTVGGQTAIIECTLKISDFQSKIGKLVDRRNALVGVFGANGHPMKVHAFLVCALPRPQIVVKDAQLAQEFITLICKEDLVRAFEQIRFLKDPDQMLDAANAKIIERHQYAL